MTLARRTVDVLAFPALAAGVIAVSMAVVRSAAFATEPSTLATAVTVDLAVGLPLLGYLCLVRPRRAPAIVLAPLFVLGNLLAAAVVPREHQQLLQGLEVGVVAVELGLIGLLAWRLGALIRHVRRARGEYVYPTDAVRAGAAAALGTSPLIGFAVTEIVVLATALTGWFRRPSLPLGFAAFSVARAGGSIAFFTLVFAVMPIELVVLHLLIAKASETAAWVVTGLGMYGVIWFLGDLHILRLEPVGLGPDELHVRVGLRWRARIRRDDIVAASVHVPEGADGAPRLTVLGEPDMWLTTRRPVTVHGLFGRTRTGRVLGLSVADPDCLVAELTAVREPE